MNVNGSNCNRFSSIRKLFIYSLSLQKLIHQEILFSDLYKNSMGGADRPIEILKNIILQDLPEDV